MKKTTVQVEDHQPEAKASPKQTTAPEALDAPVDTKPAEKATSSEPNPAEAALVELTNDLQRTRADFENYRKQVEAQKSQAMTAARMATVMKFLPLIDDLQRAINAYSEQLSPLQKSFDKTLGELGLSKINSEPGTEFNPDFHEAVSVEDGDGDLEVISETLRPGYLYEGNVLRAAMVKVTHQ